ncbi:hypothetical protein [Bacillus sp. T33-2]|uniref:hypothetical protein n=1 Tax=Bacillus sp. T33-2 TaxID=2054168 RepID=UPI000C794A54|nr:hypothetical protein [Bacillus sp. T33-2]PLR94129.1 hypothetical protein CVD19_17760 [Bacillus sp. T33-2]
MNSTQMLSLVFKTKIPQRLLKGLASRSGARGMVVPALMGVGMSVGAAFLFKRNKRRNAAGKGEFAGYTKKFVMPGAFTEFASEFAAVNHMARKTPGNYHRTVGNGNHGKAKENGLKDNSAQQPVHYDENHFTLAELAHGADSESAEELAEFKNKLIEENTHK